MVSVLAFPLSQTLSSWGYGTILGISYGKMVTSVTQQGGLVASTGGIRTRETEEPVALFLVATAGRRPGRKGGRSVGELLGHDRGDIMSCAFSPESRKGIVELDCQGGHPHLLA